METVAAWKIIFLGVLHGVTEFLPVSSSAHFVIAQQWLNLSKDGAFLMALEVALRFGTLGALIAYFYRDLLGLGHCFLKPKSSPAESKHLLWLLILGSFPAALIGVMLRDFFSDLFAEIIPASFFLIITGLILWLTKWIQSPDIGLNKMGVKQALLIGLGQAVAILPGVSRSGTTISMGLFLRLKPQDSVRYSFLLGIPAVAGATILEFKHLMVMEAALLFPVLLGVLASFIVGYASIRWMLKLVEQQKLHYFSWYCWLAGGFALFYTFFLEH